MAPPAGLVAVPITRRHFQVVLGLLWILDGALQLQPFMRSQYFARLILDTNASGQAGFVTQPMLWVSGIILAHPASLDAIFAAVQVAMGLGLLWRRSALVALGASIPWALAVWYLGEGLGGLSGGHTAMVSGAPGSALLYAVLGAASWPSAGRSDLPMRRWVVGAWAMLWLGDVALMALPSQSSAGDLAGPPLALAHSAPPWLATADEALAHGILRAGSGLVAALTAMEGLIGLAGLLRGWPRRLAGALGIGLALAYWVFGQGLGQIYTGQATDPNTGPMVVLLGVALLTCGAGRTAPGPPGHARCAWLSVARRRTPGRARIQPPPSPPADPA